jgi:hypothetical protein
MHRLVLRLLGTALVVSGILLAVGAGSRAQAQADPSNNASVTLVNKSGQDTHMWLGHSDAPQAWLIPNGFGLWWMTLKGERDFAGGPWNYNDKVRVNALTKGRSKSNTVTREFPIRGHATNMKVIWDGSSLTFDATYPANEGGTKAGGGAGSDQAAGAAGVAGSDQIAGMTPEEVTEALNNAVIAVIMGILIAGLGAAGAETAPVDGGAAGTTAPETPAPTGPMDSGLRDPDSGDVVVGWEAGKYDPASGGQAGDVWYDGRWQPSAEAAAQIQSTRDRQAAQQAFNEQQLGDSRSRNAQLDREAHARQLEADAQARAERDRLANNLGVAREEAKLAVQQTIKDAMARNAATAEKYRQSADRWDTAATVGSGVLKTADIGVDILGDHTGPLGKAINIGYTFTRTAAEKLAEGKTLGDAGRAGLTEVVLDQIKGAIVDKVGYKTPNLSGANALSPSTYLQTKVSNGLRTTKIRSTWLKATANELLGLGYADRLNKGAELTGLKERDG